MISGHPISTGFRGLTGCQRDLQDRGVTSLLKEKANREKDERRREEWRLRFRSTLIVNKLK